MSGTWIIRKAAEHQCDIPALVPAVRAYAGDVWQCSICDQHWVVYDDGRNDIYFTRIDSASVARLLTFHRSR